MSGVSSQFAVVMSGLLAVVCAALIIRVNRRRKAGPSTWLFAVAIAIGLGTWMGLALQQCQIEELAKLPAVVPAPVEPREGDTGGHASPEDVRVEANGPAETDDEGPGETALSPALAIPPPPPPPRASSPDLSERYRREARDLATDPERCTDAEDLARVWAMHPSVARDDPSFMRLHIATTWIERCRQKLRTARVHRVKVERIDGRRKFAGEVKARLRSAGQSVKVDLAGPTEEKLRIVGGSFDEASSRALVDEGLGDELAALGFLRVTFVRYTQRHRYPIAGVRAERVVDEQLTALGIGEPFAL